MSILCHTTGIIPTHSGYKEILKRNPLIRFFFASSLVLHHVVKAKTKTRGTIKENCMVYLTLDLNCNLCKLENPDIYIKALPVCLFTTHNTLTIIVSEVYFNALMNKL